MRQAGRAVFRPEDRSGFMRPQLAVDTRQAFGLNNARLPRRHRTHRPKLKPGRGQTGRGFSLRPTGRGDVGPRRPEQD
jgi:hypothetical protein